MDSQWDPLIPWFCQNDPTAYNAVSSMVKLIRRLQNDPDLVVRITKDEYFLLTLNKSEEFGRLGLHYIYTGGFLIYDDDYRRELANRAYSEKKIKRDKNYSEENAAHAREMVDNFYLMRRLKNHLKRVLSDQAPFKHDFQ